MEEEGVKEGGEKPRGARTADKAGWIKKSSGGFLGLWKDRYLLLCQAQLLVYENEDEQKCVETVELGCYEKCQDLRALLKRKHRFILLRSPGNKVSDIKFQAPSGEEKESWIKALNEGINRGKNKAFDEVRCSPVGSPGPFPAVWSESTLPTYLRQPFDGLVKVDKTCALEHVTRDRVRGGQRRRPPTRIHLKEVASAASDGLSRLDLDVPDSGPPVFVPSNDVRATQPREKPRPPMPPTKLSPVPETTSLGDRAETPAGDSAPPPDPASAEAHSESQEDAETPAGADSSSEQPLNGVLPDKLKVSWENPGPEEPSDHENAAPSQGPCSETSEAAPKESGKPPTPPPKILSEKLRASISGREASGPAPSTGTAETSAPSPAQVSVNGVDDGPEPAKPSQATGTPGTPPEDAEKSTALPSWDLPSQFHHRCASLGDLLGEGPRHPQQPGERLYRAHLEVKVASEQTEKLLNKMLGGEPAPVSAETLLSQAVEQLRQATQVLQEIRDLGELGQETPGLREKRKELVTLYRRSAP
ncbi:Pleckstrin homology domain-containing family O member 2 [Galemys pyrenaicus]|uniref:Pleckstrin homology domain-containing family O member 2 n=1 Tax=Galemys pyrenaicus TaxID=202257 RepID=A0A8J5ZUD3_GALPY|nr:Pleckstrin homology domain-containing family O member 2 [Galemys pyrenaicus]